MYQRDFENSVVLKYCLVGDEGRSFEENVYNNSLISYNIIFYKRFVIFNNGLWTTTAFTSHNYTNDEFSTCVQEITWSYFRQRYLTFPPFVYYVRHSRVVYMLLFVSLRFLFSVKQLTLASVSCQSVPNTYYINCLLVYTYLYARLIDNGWPHCTRAPLNRYECCSGK